MNGDTRASRPVGPVVVMGVSGSGKSTVGVDLATALGVPFVDGDALHPAANIAKMAAGIPLDDADRAPWLTAVGEALADGAAAHGGIVIACSALRRAYRDRLRALAPGLVFVHLTGSRELLAARLAGRSHEFMPSTLLDSQLATLEPLERDEASIALDVGERVDDLVASAARGLRGVRAASPSAAAAAAALPAATPAATRP
ncbi:gluconokinase [Schumannella luteola]|uniref:Gluconokinase n=1 Tax=Schumannella luteola TaxID=472059 RepID=A0A852Y5W2_9MICO|nr:gluconokinase [Schumannella luteola]NYG97653.1 carbohydrate kinase (thermoresistant glucokinase family) [Schumannella luteola]TPX04702.1 gluconokinase [Schumannella luteola]